MIVLDAQEARTLAEKWTTRHADVQKEVAEIALQSGRNMALLVQAIDDIYGPKLGPQNMRSFLAKVTGLL